MKWLNALIRFLRWLKRQVEPKPRKSMTPEEFRRRSEPKPGDQFDSGLLRRRDED